MPEIKKSNTDSEFAQIPGNEDSNSNARIGPQSSTIYKIINRKSGKVLDVKDGSTQDGAQIVQWTDNGGDNQHWQLISAVSGYYKIKNVKSGKLMDIEGASKNDGANNIQWNDNGGLNQQWQFIDVNGTYYKIKNHNSGKLLDINGGSTANGAKDIQWYDNGGTNQQWDIVPIGGATPRQLLWSEEFNYTGSPDPNKWGYEIGYVRNNEAQYYTNNNASVNGSNLVITAKRNDQGHTYTASSIITQDKVAFGKGYYELRAKLPTASGMWPAWWTLGENVSSKGWPYCGEIDMMEYYNNKLLFNVMNSKQQWVSKTKTLPSGFGNDYHIWGMTIDDNNIYLYLDGVEMVKYPQSSAWNGSYNPFLSQNMYMLVNLALGGANGGSLTNTSFPQYYYVDYIRYYSLGY